MSKKYKVAVVIGRFQPFHNQHAALVKKGFEIADDVVVLVGGAFKPRTPKDPFNFIERTNMIGDWYLEIHESFGDAELAVQPIRDYMYSDATWAENVQRTVAAEFIAENTEIVIVGCNKDESSFYLKMFPQWALHEEPYNEHIDATQIRELLYDDRSLDFLKGAVPAPTLQFLREFKDQPEFVEIVHERDVVAKYRKSWERAPYAPTFITTDAVVIQSGHILLVTRGSAPGKNLLALPGGFLEQDERIIDGVIRELREETKIKVAAPVLRGSIRETQIFDHPKRSSRGRTVTNAALIALPDGPLPKVKGSDDAIKAAWYPLGELSSENFFEDHWDIIEYFKARV
jgi:bifunctional NMN adenylyltransferase/nudix hydrolase